MKILVDTAVELPVNIMPLLSDSDFKTRQTSVAYNASGMDLVWNFVTPAGVITQTAVTPTTSGDYDWSHIGDGMYKIEVPASGGASINNNAEGYGYFTGIATGVFPWRSPTFEFVPANIANSLVLGTDYLQVDTTQVSGDSTAADTLELFAEALDQSTGQIDDGTLKDNSITAAALKADAVAEIKAALDTTAMTESYASNGAAPTKEQALFAIHQILMQFAISSTNLTVKKLDNSTTAFVVTLDDATTPTSAART